ncbi:MAG: ribonuclease domain-containing protein [Bacillota bacterium]|nr:ribonuclease domain-containing protein [Bacillota bacterium]
MQTDNHKTIPPEGQEKTGSPVGKFLCIAAILLAVLSVIYGIVSLSRLESQTSLAEQITLTEDGHYHSAEDVASYLYKYGHLPSNYVTKTEAQLAGWIGGSLESCLPGHAIGGDRFYSSYMPELQLPEAVGRYYRECDVNTLGKDTRGSERLLYSNDGLIYYSPDHYNTLVLLYGDPE